MAQNDEEIALWVQRTATYYDVEFQPTFSIVRYRIRCSFFLYVTEEQTYYIANE